MLSRAACRQGFAACPRSTVTEGKEGSNNRPVCAQEQPHHSELAREGRLQPPLSGTATLPVEKVFLAEVMPASPKDNDIALVKLQSPLHVSGETWHTPP